MTDNDPIVTDSADYEIAVGVDYDMIDNAGEYISSDTPVT